MKKTTLRTQRLQPGGALIARRALLAAGAAIALSSGSTAFAQAVELKVSHYVPTSHTIHQELLRWADDMDKKSNGRLKITVYPASQMGPITRQYDLARTGVADIAYFLHGATPGRFPLTELAQLPYVFNPEAGGMLQKPVSSAEASALVTGLASQLDKEYEGTKLLMVVAQPNLSLMFNKASVHQPADMKGMRLRHNGPLAAKMIEALGASPAAVSPVELADALEKGTVKGMVFNYEAGQAFQMGSAVTSVTELNFSAVTLGLAMNEKKYESLPADLRKLIDDSMGVEAARRMGGKFDEAEAAGRRYLVDKKVEIIVPNADEVQAFRAPLKPVVEQTIEAVQAKGLPARKFYDDLRARVNAVKR
ncbi:TRAP transporter substrate-binding protein [Hydrogenophaga sp.]|uniref:TRAP transporter substrate-binding protein n=1 Tax=Hydrogenophaga sp. TaxID=1904254 RepID=UPI0035674686